MVHRRFLKGCGDAFAAPTYPVTRQGVVSTTLLLTVLAVVAWWQTAPALGQDRVKSEKSTLELAIADLCALAKPGDKYLESVPDASKLGVDQILAFEENQYFVYVLGIAQAAKGKPDAPSLVRRVFLLKPSVFVVDDQIRSQGAVPWVLQGSNPPKIEGRRAHLAEGTRQVVCETLLPRNTTLKAVDNSLVESAPKPDARETRFLHVIRIDQPDPKKETWGVEKNGLLQLTIPGKERTFQLTLAPGDAAGKIAVLKPDGKPLLAKRLLPSGIMPHGKEGVGLIERWDSAYRRDRKPGWDTGRPSVHLKKVVEDGTIRPCRAVVLGCGTGTNAIYLAGKGFDVTGVDIAPTALTLAEGKAQKAGVKVKWVVADVLALPKSEPFEFIFDRGCYHGVRRGNAAGYVATAGQLTRPGSRILILAGNANEARHYGPPRVKQQDICGDFSEAFDIVWLQETKFDLGAPDGNGPLAWSILLRRKKEK